jgi:hypothetical protein
MMDHRKRLREESPKVDGPLSLLLSSLREQGYVISRCPSDSTVFVVNYGCVKGHFSDNGIGDQGSFRHHPSLGHSCSRADEPRPLSLTIGRQGIWTFVLERDKARRLHSSSIHEVA